MIDLSDLKNYLKQLSEMHGPTGDESEVSGFMKNEFKKHGFKVEEDVLGNVIARKGKGKRVLFAAHMDEISLVVSAVTDQGFLKFVRVGGVNEALLPGTRVLVHADKRLHGVVGTKPPHLMKEEDRKIVLKTDQLFIDVGAKDKKEAEKMGIKPGVHVTFNSNFVELTPDLVLGKAFDDRAGCAVLLDLADKAKPTDCELILVGTVREETGLFGAGASVFSLDPDLAVSVDVTTCGGTPDIAFDQVPVEIGKGPVLQVMEAGGRGLIIPKRLVKWLDETAKKHKINLQRDVSEGGASDASRMQYVKAGFLVGSVGIPCRYVHSQNEIVSLKDLQQASDLLLAASREFKQFK
ncbi:MAG: M42 family metallopeptidase [Candidatus Micrarchaeota archaeon]